jgi:AraC family transcriptional regulator of adaptative response/methylated-DNA-[protein]-cysteine methyltransferase
MKQMNLLPTVTEMQQAVFAKNTTYDGIFFTGVRTTGIFCRPSCTAKKPQAGNMEFFATVKEAMFAGYRPCLRCRPLEAAGSHPQWVQELLEEIEKDLHRRIQDGHLRQMDLDPARVRRYFLSHFGMTFQAYCRARRMQRAFEQIRSGSSLDEVALGFGYDSHSGFREAFVRTFGTPPGQSRSLNCVVMSWVESPLGPLLAGANDKGACLLEFSDRRMLEAQMKALRKYFRCPIVPGEHPHLVALKQQLQAYFEGRLRKFTVPLDYPGSEFQTKVWNALLEIPYGETRSYEDLAKTLGSVKAVRAVGHANGLNRIAVVIPCHRVVNKDGKLGGYGGGLWRKQYLLDLERRQATT